MPFGSEIMKENEVLEFKNGRFKKKCSGPGYNFIYLRTVLVP